jgi:hypothetical protein
MFSLVILYNKQVFAWLNVTKMAWRFCLTTLSKYDIITRVMGFCGLAIFGDL